MKSVPAIRCPKCSQDVSNVGLTHTVEGIDICCACFDEANDETLQ